VAFSQTDFTEDLKKITVPVLVMHGDDDLIVPYADSGPLSAQLLPNGTLKTYNGFHRTACRPPRPRRSTLTCWPSCSPDRPAAGRLGPDAGGVGAVTGRLLASGDDLLGQPGDRPVP